MKRMYTMGIINKSTLKMLLLILVTITFNTLVIFEFSPTQNNNKKLFNLTFESNISAKLLQIDFLVMR
jgi:hypothetical protein